MASYESLLKQIADLRAEAEAVKAIERKAALAYIKRHMREFGISIADLGDHRTPYIRPGPEPIQYMDPSTGKTWTGRGRAPLWLREQIRTGKKKEDFFIGEIDRS